MCKGLTHSAYMPLAIADFIWLFYRIVLLLVQGLLDLNWMHKYFGKALKTYPVHSV